MTTTLPSFPPPPQEAISILEFFKKSLQKEVPGLIEGLYVYGSATLGDYQVGRSDLDFVAFSCQNLNQDELLRLAGIHNRLNQQFPHSKLNGLYLDWSNLGKPARQSSPGPGYFNGRMLPATREEMNLITWFQLKNNALSLLGPDPQRLPFKVNAEDMLTELHGNLAAYWEPWLLRHQSWYRPQYWLLVFFGQKVEWSVLGISRLYYTFKTGAITSKSGAGKYCLEVLPEEYHQILREALNIRQGKGSSLYSGKVARAKAALEYLRSVIKLCRKEYARHHRTGSAT